MQPLRVLIGCAEDAFNLRHQVQIISKQASGEKKEHLWCCTCESVCHMCNTAADWCSVSVWLLCCFYRLNSISICDGRSRPAAKVFLTQPAFIKHPSDAFPRTGVQPSSERHSYIANNFKSPGYFLEPRHEPLVQLWHYVLHTLLKWYVELP